MSKIYWDDNFWCEVLWSIGFYKHLMGFYQEYYKHIIQHTIDIPTI